MTCSPYAGADPAKLDEIIRLAELQLAAQLSLGVAADQRAMTMASFLASLDAAAIAFWGVVNPTAWVSMLVLVIGFALAAGMAAASALPTHWEIAGNEPGNWLDDIVEGDTLHNGKAAMAGFYQDMIRSNADCLSSNSRLIAGAFVTMIVTLVLAGVALMFQAA